MIPEPLLYVIAALSAVGAVTVIRKVRDAVRWYREPPGPSFFNRDNWKPAVGYRRKP